MLCEDSAWRVKKNERPNEFSKGKCTRKWTSKAVIYLNKRIGILCVLGKWQQKEWFKKRKSIPTLTTTSFHRAETIFPCDKQFKKNEILRWSPFYPFGGDAFFLTVYKKLSSKNRFCITFSCVQKEKMNTKIKNNMLKEYQ